MKVRTFADLMGKHQSAEILCMMREVVVRRLKVEGDRVIIDAMQPPIVSVPLTETILYEPWFMDRGSLLFRCREIGGKGKICTELDIIRYPDGTTETIEPEYRLKG
jgi:hypothetical protein